MTRIGLLSDTHGYWDDRYLRYFEPCDEIWHAGDIGSTEVADRLARFRPLRAVYGNIDGADLRRRFPQTLRFVVDGAEVLMKHIGGYPGRYDPSIAGSILSRPPTAPWGCCTSTPAPPASRAGTRCGRWCDSSSTAVPSATWRSSNWRTSRFLVK